MLRPIDRERRDGPLYPGADRTLRDCFDRRHLLVRIDATFDFAELASSLHTHYHPTTGRPAIHPEIVLRGLLLAGLYGVTSNRELCERIAENLAWRWFCHLTLDDPVFDHSSLSVFLERVGSDALQQLFGQLNERLRAAGLLSRRTYLDSSLVAANVRTQNLRPRDKDDEPPDPVKGTESFLARDITPGEDTAPDQITARRYQDAEGRLPLPDHDRDCRWLTIRGKATLGYKDHVWGDRSGFVLGYERTPATTTDVAGAMLLIDRLPIDPRSVAADTGYCAGQFRHELWRREITAYIPLHPTQDATPEEFTDHFDHFVCSQGKQLRPTGVPGSDHSVRYAARAADCRPCPLKATCVSASRDAKVLYASRYRVTYPLAHRLNATVQYEREQRRRKTVAEGIFARLDRLGGTRTRYRSLERGRCEGTLTVMAHNIRKAMTTRRFFRRDPGAQPGRTPSAASAAAVYRLLRRLHPAPFHPLTLRPCLS